MPQKNRARPSVIARLFLLVIKIYQRTLAHFIGGACRFNPSCSNYGLEAVTKHGAFRGGWLTLRRISRCHPWGATGDDPVPEKNTSDDQIDS